MRVVELLQGVRFLIDGEGNKKAVVLDLALWEELLAWLKDVEKTRQLEQAKETTHLQQSEAKLREAPSVFDVPRQLLAEENRVSHTVEHLLADPAFEVPARMPGRFGLVEPAQGKGIAASRLLVEDRK